MYYENLKNTVVRLIQNRFNADGLDMKVDDFLDLPLCEQRKYIEKNTGIKARVTCSNYQILTAEQIDSELINYSLRTK